MIALRKEAASWCAALGSETENATERRFCGACGVPLTIVWSSCDFANKPGSRFCGGCGMALGAAPGGVVPSRAAGECRQVTVLLADLDRFHPSGTETDAEELHRLLGQAFELIDRIIETHGGWVDKHIGDCVIGVFGAPVAHDNDAEPLTTPSGARRRWPRLRP